MAGSQPGNPMRSLQEQFAARSICFGCGPANPDGLHIQSVPEGDDLVAVWTSKPHHEAFAGALNGGIIGILFDCHCNWTAAYFLMRRDQLDKPPCTVTAQYGVKFLRPTPSGVPVTLRSHVVESSADRATVEGSLEAGGIVCATARGTFVAVKPGHPAYHRW
jgi:acyl-coenzyme A thioesterase PaaI-like protein